MLPRLDSAHRSESARRVRPVLAEAVANSSDTPITCRTARLMAAGLPHLHQAMLASGHPQGLDVTFIDGDSHLSYELRTPAVQ